MTKHILQCPECKSFTIKSECETCKVSSVSIKPPKYSPEDKYGQYRRSIKEPEYRLTKRLE